jgi:site-specific recombinase XerD
MMPAAELSTAWRLAVAARATVCHGHHMDPPPGTRWASLIEAFVAHERAVAGLAPDTLRHRHLHMRTFARWWEATRSDRPVQDASTADLAAFLVAESDRGMSAFTRKAEVAVLRRFYGWLVLTGGAGHDPTVQLHAPRVAPVEIAIYPPAHIDAILTHTAALDELRGCLRYTIVASLRYTGMRSGELRTLRLDRLDLDAGQAAVVGKGARPRLVVIPAPLRPILQRFLDEVRPQLPDSPLLLANPHPAVTTPLRGFGPEALYREVELAGQHAGVPGRHFPHRWRHTFATELVRAGVDIHVVQRLLGHRSVTSTVGYTHLAVDDLKAAVTGLW